MGYDNTGGATTETRFGGWVDDLSVDQAPAVDLSFRLQLI